MRTKSVRWKRAVKLVGAVCVLYCKVCVRKLHNQLAEHLCRVERDDLVRRETSFVFWLDLDGYGAV